MNQTTPAIQIESVEYGYAEDRPVLQGINITAHKGQTVALIGPSGCGKSTLLRLITGQIHADVGSVRVLGQDVAKLSQDERYRLRHRLGMMFQFGALFTDLSVFDNVAFPLREHTKLPESAIRDLVLLKLEAVGLRGTHAMMPAELSGGMARRVALARTIALDPEVILFDEPFTGLDPISMRVAGDLIKRLNDALGACSLVVTHDIEESLSIVDYLYFIFQGKVVAHGTPSTIRQNDDPLVQQFLQGKPDGPLHFHYPAKPLQEELAVLDTALFADSARR